MQRSPAIVFASFLLSIPLSIPLPASAATAEHAGHAAVAATQAAKPTPAAVAAALRDLWTGHVFWVRNVVVGTFGKDASAAAEAETQVVANAHAIAGAIEPYYGKAASERLFGLLAGHYAAVKKILLAVAAGDDTTKQSGQVELGANAAEIARFLSGANPNLPFDTLNALLAAHGAHHVQQIDELQRKDYSAEARTWEAMKNHMLGIADALAGGIAKQFPDKFA